MSNQSNSQMAVSSTMVALYNFEAHDEPEISMKKGDRIEMLDMDPALNGWAYGRKKTDGSEGYVPISYLGSSNSSSNRSHKHSKSVSQPSRSSSPNPSKSRHDDNKNYRQNYGRNNQNNYNSHNNMNNNNNNVHGNNNNQSNDNSSNNLHGNNNNNNMNQNTNSNSNSNNNMIQQQNNNSNQKQQQNNMSSNNMNNSNNNNNNNNMNNINDPSSDAKQIICSFHRDFIPEMNDLYKYFGEFGKITNKLEIEYDAKKVPLAKIKFASASCVDKVCDKGGRQQIPSQSQNGTIHIRVYRSMQDYLNNTQRSNRSHGGYNKHKNSRRGGF